MALRRTLSDPKSGPLVGILTVLLVSGASLAGFAVPQREAPAPLGSLDERDAGHDHSTHSHTLGEAGHALAGMPVVRCPEEAAIPDPLDLSLETFRAIRIEGDEGFSPASGVARGIGTAEDPFVITGLRVDRLELRDTRAYFVVAGNDIGDLVLNWNGKGGLVCRNHIADLRVNQNVERVEAPTAGIVEQNRIDSVGQIRHFDGVFRDNEVGTPTSRGVVLNIDGMNGADFRGNLVRGGVDMKLHGHHHGKPGESHVHVVDPNVTDDEDHTLRHVLFQFRDNVVQDPSGFGLRYNDRNHAGDDRTATSETTPSLEKPHVHRTTILIEGNRVEGAPLRLEVVNAEDERHLAGERAEVVVRKNTIVGALAGSALVASAMRNARIVLEGNTVERTQLLGTPLHLGRAAGLDLLHVENATVLVTGNVVDGYTYGVRARDFDAATRWIVAGNTVTGATRDVWWDDTVANPPASA